MSHPAAFVLVGATATGKTAVCQRIAEATGATILSTDALLVYKGMDIGTAKPSVAEQRRARTLGIDLFTPAEPSNAGLWLDAVRARITPADTAQPLLVTGGTGLYLRALLSPFDAPPPDPASRARWQSLFETNGLEALQRVLRERLPAAAWDAIPDTQNPRRLLRLLERLDAGESPGPVAAPPPLPQSVILGLQLPRGQLHQRIADRVQSMLGAGLVEEVRALRRDFPAWSDTARAAIGYAEICDFLDGRLGLPDATERIIIRTRQLAKRQHTWFQNQHRVTWLETTLDEPGDALAGRVLNAWRQHGPATLAAL